MRIGKRDPPPSGCAPPPTTSQMGARCRGWGWGVHPATPWGIVRSGWAIVWLSDTGFFDPPLNRHRLLDGGGGWPPGTVALRDCGWPNSA